MNHNIFIYGTLKEGFPNYIKYNGHQCLGKYKTISGFSLYLVGERFSPWMVQSGSNNVVGELFHINDENMIRIDLLERIDQPDGYSKVKIDIINVENNKFEEAFTYIKSIKQLELAKIMKGPIFNYTLELSKKYQSRK